MKRCLAPALLSALFATACGSGMPATSLNPSATTTPGVKAAAGSVVTAQATVGQVTLLSIDPSVFRSGSSTRGTVHLASPAGPGGVVVVLSADDSLVTLPATLTVAEGATSGTFGVTTRSVESDSEVRITASGGGGSWTALTLLKARNALTSLDVSPGVRSAGLSVTGTVTLSSPAPVGGTVVTLTSNRDTARPPSTVTVPAGARTVTFTIPTAVVCYTQEVWVTATVDGDSLSTGFRMSIPPTGCFL